MSIIAVENVPPMVGLKYVMKDLRHPIHGAFEALYFEKSTKTNQKICYVQLSEKVDPVHAVQNINNSHYKSGVKYYAYIPDTVPDMPLGSMKARLERANPAMRKILRLAQKNGEIFKVTTDEVMTELQAKYPGLYNLSKKYDHKVFQELSKKIYSRIKVVVDKSTETLVESSSFKITRAYRRAHPHTGDFQLVLSTIHDVEDAAGMPRMELQESDIMAVSSATYVLDLPKEKVKSICDKYTSSIGAKITEHVNSLDAEINATDTEAEIAKKQVRQELKKLQPFLNIIISQAVGKHLLTPEDTVRRMMVYGEPTLPNKETMVPFLARYQPKHVMRSMKMFNLLMLSVTPASFQQLIAMNGTVLNGSKLVIVSSDVILFKASKASLRADQGDLDENCEPMDEDEENKFWDSVEREL